MVNKFNFNTKINCSFNLAGMKHFLFSTVQSFNIFVWFHYQRNINILNNFIRTKRSLSINLKLSFFDEESVYLKYVYNLSIYKLVPSLVAWLWGYFISDLFNDLYCRTPNLMSSYAMISCFRPLLAYCIISASVLSLGLVTSVLLFWVYCSVPGLFLVCVCRDFS